MTKPPMTPPKPPKDWSFPASGPVRYNGGASDIALGLLSQLQDPRDAKTLVEIPLPLEDDAAETSKTVAYDALDQNWRESGGVFFSPAGPIQQRLIFAALDALEGDLNAALCAHLTAHSAITSKVAYASGAITGLPERGSQLPRPWRREQAQWFDAHRAEAGDTAPAPRDSVDLAFDLLARLPRPVDMDWTYRPAPSGQVHFSLFLPPHTVNPVLQLERSSNLLSVDRARSVPGNRTPWLMAQSSFVALALALRLFAGKRLGDVVMTAFLRQNFGSTMRYNELIQFVISGRGWVRPLSVLKHAPLGDFHLHTDPDARFFSPGSAGWVHPLADTT